MLIISVIYQSLKAYLIKLATPREVWLLDEPEAEPVTPKTAPKEIDNFMALKIAEYEMKQKLRGQK